MKIIITFLGLLFIAFNTYSQEWKTIDFPNDENLTGICFIHPDTGFVITHRGNVGITYNGGKEWFLINVANGVPLEDVFFYDSDDGLVCGHDGSVYRTTDGGNSWRIVASSGAYIKYIDLEMIDKKNGYVVGMESKSNSPNTAVVKRTQNGGATWENAETVGMGALEMFTRPGLPLYFITFGVVNRSYDNGFHWQSARTNHQSPARTISMYDHAGIIAGPNGMCAFTADSGKTWNIVPQNEERFFIASEMLDDQTAYIGGAENCLMKTIDGGITWTEETMPKPFSILDFSLAGNRLYACGVKGGLMVLELKKE